MKRYVDRITFACVCLLVVAGVTVLVLPLVCTIVMSLESRSSIGRFPPPGLSLQWYARFFADQYFLSALWISLIAAVVSAAISSLLGTMAALGLARASFPGAAFLNGLFLAPIIVPGVVTGFSLLVFFATIGLESNLARIVLAHVLVTLPYTIRTSLAVISSIPPTLMDAAMSLGATEGQALRRVLLPLARTGIATGFIFAFAFSMDDVSVTIFLTSPRVYTLPVAMASNMKADLNLTIAAASVMLMGLAVIAILVLERLAGVSELMGRGIYRT
ncbi:ABC transporter permease [Mesorhizobium sp. ASY16-5R]|uniref:ABC transporter permease n=1 Tax=Mesorhizobium sp. ASY16-5R TaxID=3445772 RepID=UPI003FA0225A